MLTKVSIVGLEHIGWLAHFIISLGLVTITTETDHFGRNGACKSRKGPFFLTKQTNFYQNINLFLFYLLVRSHTTNIYLPNSIANNGSNTDVNVVRFTAISSAMKRT